MALRWKVARTLLLFLLGVGIPLSMTIASAVVLSKVPPGHELWIVPFAAVIVSALPVWGRLIRRMRSEAWAVWIGRGQAFYALSLVLLLCLAPPMKSCC
jgi:hypothetical protein